jgi:hypothetical protein
LKSQKGLKFAIQDQKQSKTKISQEYIKKIEVFFCQRSMKMFETTSKEQNNVEEMFDSITDMILKSKNAIKTLYWETEPKRPNIKPKRWQTVKEFESFFCSLHIHINIYVFFENFLWKLSNLSVLNIVFQIRLVEN